MHQSRQHLGRNGLCEMGARLTEPDTLQDYFANLEPAADQIVKTNARCNNIASEITRIQA